MSKITEIVEESKVQLEIIEPGGGQIEIVDNSTKLEIVESGSFMDPTTLDITPQTNTIIIDSTTENTTVDISVNEPTTVETTIVNTAIDIIEDQVVYQTGSIFQQLFFPVTESITNNFNTENITQSITNSTTVVQGDTIVEGGFFIESGGLFQSITQSGNDFTPQEISDLLDLIHDKGTVNLSVNPSSFEKNKPTNATFEYRVTLNDDTISSATFDGTDVTSNPNGNNSYENLISSLTKIYSVTFTRNLRGASDDATITAREPQYHGVSSIEDFNNKTYSEVNTNLTKKIISGDSITQIVSPTNQFVYFLSTNNNATITDGNGFDNTADFNKTTITVKYFDGVNNQTLTQYRTKDTKTLTDFEYNIT